jgi:hypothetical protein
MKALLTYPFYIAFSIMLVATVVNIATKNKKIDIYCGIITLSSWTLCLMFILPIAIYALTTNNMPFFAEWQKEYSQINKAINITLLTLFPLLIHVMTNTTKAELQKIRHLKH